MSLIEAYELLGTELNRRGKVVENLKETAIASLNHATVINLPPSKTPLSQLDNNLIWLVSSSDCNYSTGSVIDSTSDKDYIKSSNGKEVRLIGFTDSTLSFSPSSPLPLPHSSIILNPWENIPHCTRKTRTTRRNKQQTSKISIHPRKGTN
ncbi:MAG: hypothetical protein HC903_15990 [Methylacidiphilales bacterium]|nr:hypothetical protein [Candidatus Methylacidiphilales bacterium]